MAVDRYAAYKRSQKERDEKKKEPKTKRVTKDGKVFTVTSTDGGKTWTNPKPYSGKAGLFSQVKNPFRKSEKSSKKSNKLKIAGAGDKPGATRAKEMAKSRIKAKKTIAQSHADNMSSMRKAAAKRHDDFQKKNKRGKYRVSKK